MKRLKETKYHAKLLLQVHDELIFEIPKSEVEDFSKFVEEIMEQAFGARCTFKSRFELWCNMVRC